MTRRSFRHVAWFARLAALTLVLALIPLERSMAAHDVKEAWTKFQEACQKLKSLKAQEKEIVEKYVRAVSDFEALECAKEMELAQRAHVTDRISEGSGKIDDYLTDVCRKVVNDLSSLEYQFMATNLLVKEQQIDCRREAATYQTAVNEVITEISTIDAFPAPGALTGQNGKPPTGGQYTTKRSRHKSTTSTRKTRKTRSRHSDPDSRAAAVITGIILWGVGQAISSGSRGGSRGGGGGGSRGGRGAAIP